MIIYKYQAVEFILETFLDLSGASSPKIHYRKPNGDTGYWVATISGTKLIYQTNNTDLDKTALWTLQSSVVIDSLERPGKICSFYVNERL